MSGSLVKKLADVMAAVERVPKRGRNEFHRYDYATEADIVATVRKELAERHVMLIPAIVNETRTAVGEKGSVLTTLEMEMEFFDGESGESIKKPWRGYGTDKEDKGGYKAMTGGEKYFLLKTFLMPTGDDPEAEQPQRRSPEQRQQDRRDNAAATQRVADKMREQRTNGHAAPPPNVNTQTGEITDDGLLTVRNVAETSGTNSKSGKAWTKFTVHFSDGSKASTFSTSFGDLAKKAKREGLKLRVLTKQGQYGSEIEALDVVTAEAPAPGGLEEPPGLMDESIPF